jgi:hypothetical protein
MATKTPPKAAAISAWRLAATYLTHYAGSDAAEARELLLDLAAQLELNALTSKAALQS